MSEIVSSIWPLRGAENYGNYNERHCNGCSYNLDRIRICPGRNRNLDENEKGGGGERERERAGNACFGKRI